MPPFSLDRRPFTKPVPRFGSRRFTSFPRAGATPVFSPVSLIPFSWHSFRAPYLADSPALGAAITTVTDRGLNAKTLSQAGATNAVRQADAAGREGALFDGTSSRLRNASYSMDLATGWTVYQAFRVTANSGVTHQIGTVNVNSGLLAFVNGTAQIRAYPNGGGGVTSSSLTLDIPYWFCHWSDGVNERLYVDGTLVDTQAAGTPAASTVLSIGGTDNFGPFAGFIYESLFFETPHTASELVSMFGYMNSLAA